MDSGRPLTGLGESPNFEEQTFSPPVFRYPPSGVLQYSPTKVLQHPPQGCAVVPAPQVCSGVPPPACCDIPSRQRKFECFSFATIPAQLNQHIERLQQPAPQSLGWGLRQQRQQGRASSASGWSPRHATAAPAGQGLQCPRLQSTACDSSASRAGPTAWHSLLQ